MDDSERTYRAIGRFILNSSQMEYAVRHFLGEEIGLKEQYFSAVVESYDTAMLIGIAIEVFKSSRGDGANAIWKLLNRFRGLNVGKNVNAWRMVYGSPLKDGGTVHYTSRNKLTGRVTDQAHHLEKLSDDYASSELILKQRR